jgi:hypothetical protein
MEAATLSALAAWAAAAVTLIGAAFQFFIGRKQADAAFNSANAALKSSENAGRAQNRRISASLDSKSDRRDL